MVRRQKRVRCHVMAFPYTRAFLVPSPVVVLCETQYPNLTVQKASPVRGPAEGAEDEAAVDSDDEFANSRPLSLPCKRHCFCVEPGKCSIKNRFILNSKYD